MRDRILKAIKNLFTSAPTPRGPKLLFLTVLVFFSFSGLQQGDYAVQANIIYRFTKYIDWPENKKSGDFIIGIVGESPLYDELRRLSATKTVGNQKIVIVKLSPSAASYNCHILFICNDESSSVKKIAAATAGTPVLIVSESNGLARKGSCINFIIVDDRLKLEINKTNIEQRNMRIASELLELGIIIK
jgi:hypothetical protein